MARKLLRFPEICERTGIAESTHRYWRHIGEGPPMFRMGRRIVAFEDEVDAWIEGQADAARRGNPAPAA